MLKNYLLIAWRNLVKNKVFSLINIMGLTIGITCCLMIFLYIRNEMSFDSFHQKEKNIYRVMRGYAASKLRVPYLSGPYAPAMLNDFPDAIQQAVRVETSNGLITFNHKSFNEHNVYITDPDFFTLFSFPLIKGNAATALLDPASVVLTESTAKKYFGNEDPMGRFIDMDKTLHLKVTGIAKELPSNSHLTFDLVVPLSNYAKEPWATSWRSNNMFVYLLLKDHVQPAQLEKRFPQFMDKYMGQELAVMGGKWDLALTPLRSIYFEPHSAFDNVNHGDKSVVYIFLSIAILILLIACINFMNLSTIRAADRSKEVGLRKVMGALRNHLVWQFIGESVLLTTISCLLAVTLLQLLMPFYNQLLDNKLTVSWQQWPVYLFLVGIILIAGALAGSYPALFLSGFSPIQALKGRLQLGRKGTFFRQALVVVQFSISVLLIIGTIIIMNQMRYIKNKALGYHQEQTVVVRLDNRDIQRGRQLFQQTLQGQSGIYSVSLMSGEPGGFFDVNNFHAEGHNDELFRFRTEFTDFEFVKTLGLKIVAGRDFSAQYVTDSTESILINRTAAAQLGLTPAQAIGRWLENTMKEHPKRRIIGVVEDFNFLSLKEKMDALVITPNEDKRTALIRLQPGRIQPALKMIGNAYAQAAPGYEFEYSFLDQKFNSMYRADLRQQTILSIFSGLAIFIACLGLFGLASFTAAKRTKEIGVRKVLGSSISNILLLLSKELLKPVLLATAIGIPVGYYAMHRWLENFAYRTSLHWWIFALAAFVTIAIALFTVSFKALKAALANPVKSLRTE